MGNTEYFFIHKEFEELLNYFTKIYSIENIWDKNYIEAQRYISIIRTTIENIDWIYCDLDKEDPDVHEWLQWYADIIKNYFDFKLNLTLPSNQTADWLALFIEMRKIKWYLFKMFIIFEKNNTYDTESFIKLKKEYDLYISTRNMSYANLRKELEEYEKQNQEQQDPEENIIPQDESMISEDKNKNETL